MYGLLDEKQLHDTVFRVVKCLGGGVNAEKLLKEVAAAETDLGNTPDTSWETGIGLMQFDKIGFDDVKARTSQVKKDKVNECFGINIDKVMHKDLRWNPLLSVIFARLKFMLVTGSIPIAQVERAQYWKTWYNSELGAGTIQHYMTASRRHGLI